MSDEEQPIVITGFMGCGKTTVARALARELGCKMIDLDEFVAEREGRSAKEIIQQDGEAAFREIETRYLERALAHRSARVIALGGGTWTIAGNRKLIAEHRCISVWLDVPFESCWERIAASGSERPLAPSKDQALELYHQRRSVYEIAGRHVHPEQSSSIDQTVAELRGAIET